MKLLSETRLGAAQKEVERKRVLKLNDCTCLRAYTAPPSMIYKECFGCGGKKLMPMGLN